MTLRKPLLVIIQPYLIDDILPFYLWEQQLAAAAQASQPQDLGLARLGALGALADLADGAVGGGDLLNEVPSTINYEDLVIGNQAAAHAGKHL